jgi:hypothetical protein
VLHGAALGAKQARFMVINCTPAGKLDALPISMIEKLEFYHGAAVVRLIEDGRCNSVRKGEAGYLVNDERTVFLKYTTKAHSPWRFTVSADDLARYDLASHQTATCILALVCGGDGVCSLTWAEGRELLGGSPGWLAAKRSFNGCYAVSGPCGTLKRKVALNRWPAIVFGQEDSE